MNKLLSLIFCFSAHALIAQFTVDHSEEDGYYNDQFMRYTNHNYRSNVKTVTLHPVNEPLEPPIIKLDGNQVLELRFDILDSTLGNFMYAFEHCDHDWKRSDLDVQEYTTGPPEDFLTDYSYARNTFQRFIHYSIKIPNESIRLTQSGNYIVKVYEDGDPDNLILTRRFCVVEPSSSVKAKINVHQATRVKERYSHQEVDFSISVGNYPLTNPYTDLKVVVLQNHTWESSLTGLQPRFVKGTELDYNYEGENVFEGLNEFRMLDLQNTRFTGQGVERVDITDQENHAYTDLNRSRAALTYLQNPDLNGWFYIKNAQIGSVDPADIDYIHVHFRLAQPSVLEYGDVYVYGALTNWQILPEAKMTYNQLEMQYECELFLKQGLYNYAYVFVRDGQMKPDMSLFEGSHFETENDYTILIYHRPFGWDFDKLIEVGEYNYNNN